MRVRTFLDFTPSLSFGLIIADIHFMGPQKLADDAKITNGLANHMQARE